MSYEDLLEKLEAVSIRLESYNDYPQAASNNAKRAIKYKEENKAKCGTKVGWTRARQLANKDKISRDTIARMASFKRHQQHADVPYSEGCGGLMWDAWGGTSGIEWAIRKLNEIDSINICNDYLLGVSYKLLSEKYNICTWSIGNTLKNTFGKKEGGSKVGNALRNAGGIFKKKTKISKIFLTK